MPTLVPGIGRMEEVDMFELIPPDEGEITQYYGRIRNGKTYAAVSDMIADLNAGKVVYSNIPVDWNGYDERTRFWPKLLGVLGLKKQFYFFPKDNLHRLDIDGNFLDKFSKLTDCKVYIDEGHIAFDSYQMTRMAMKDRVAVLDTGHYDRSIAIISQRPTAIHAVMRANVNRFFKIEKIMDFWGWRRFRKTEFQDVNMEGIPDETRKRNELGEETDEYEHAMSTKFYWGKRSIYNVYDSKFRRGDTKRSQENMGKVFTLSYSDRLRNFFSHG